VRASRGWTVVRVAVPAPLSRTAALAPLHACSFTALPDLWSLRNTPRNVMRLNLAGSERGLPRGAALARRRGLAVHGHAGELPDDHYAAVTLRNVVDLFLRPLEQMRDIHRLLAPGGLMFVRTPNAILQAAAWRLSRVVVWPPPLARLVADAHFFQPLVWAPSTLRTLLLCAGFTSVEVYNSTVSHGDPYQASSANRDRVVAAIKRVVHTVAGGVYRASRGRLVVGSSISARARKPV
jgi:hypothetical protein